MLKAFLFLCALRTHVDRLESLLGEQWPELQARLGERLNELIAEQNERVFSARVNRVFRVFAGTPAEALVRALLQRAEEQALAVKTRQNSIEQTIAHCEQTLEVNPAQTDAEWWAAAQLGLANTYSERIRGVRADNLERAIHHYEQALTVYTPEASPERWAATQNNLANAYFDRIRGERADNLEQSIHHYEQALTVYTPEAFPQDWAMTQNNLGLAHSDRTRGERADNLEQAIHHYEQALTVLTREAFPQDWAMTQNNLASAYSKRICGERAENLKLASDHREQALTVYSPEEVVVRSSGRSYLHFSCHGSYNWQDLVPDIRSENLRSVELTDSGSLALDGTNDLEVPANVEDFIAVASDLARAIALEAETAKPTDAGRESRVEAPPPLDLELPLAPEKYLVARADERVRVGVPFTLTARISTDNIPSALGQGGAVVTGDVTGKLKIAIYAPGFISNDGTQREIDVPATGNSSWVPFELVATRDGIHPIEVLAWKNSVQVGGVTISVCVGVGQLGEGWVQSGIDIREPAGGEYTLEVVFERILNKYRFQLRSDTGENWPSLYSDPLEGPLEDMYSNVISSLNTQARNLNQLSALAQSAWLKGMGATLYKLLLPSDLKQALWENRDKVKYLNILSRNEPTPWELLYISDPDGTADGEFIADAATVTRSRYGPPAGRQLSKKTPYFVLPSGSPTKAQDEVTYARKKVGAGTIIDQLDDLLKLLNAGQFSLLHFASHNVANPTVTGGLYIPFGGSKFDLTFMGAWSKNQFRSQRPLVFMNSCTSGGSVPLYTDMAGWAGSFLDAGCGAFIGSLWEIRDSSALTFAENFYDQVTGGNNLGESMRKARNALKGSDPTYLAYTLYGNPFATLS